MIWRWAALLLVPMTFGLLLTGAARAAEPVSLSERIGPELDAAERDAYRLLPDVAGFESARIVRLSPDRYRIEYDTREDGSLRHRRAEMTAGAFELTRFHVEMVEAFGRESAVAPEPLSESETMRALALRYAAAVRYDAAAVIVDDLGARFPETGAGQWAADAGPRIGRLRAAKRALIWAGALRRQEGRTELLIFSGYYGLWLGVATPVALDADSRESIALGLLLGGPAAVLATNHLARGADVSRGRSAVLRLGAHHATAQGLGWAAIGDASGRGVVAAGEAAGLVGLAGAVALTHAVDFAEGHAEIMASGMPWGAWFGLVTAELARDEEDALLRDMLIGSDVAVVGAAIAGRGAEVSRTRVRLVNLAGLIGGVFGLGVDLLAHVDDEKAAFGIAGLGSLAGLGAGVALTSNVDRGRDLSLGRDRPPDDARAEISLAPGIGVRRSLAGARRLMPVLELRAAF